MKNLPKGMLPDRDNQVYYDTEKQQFYMIEWKDDGNKDIANRIYIPEPQPIIERNYRWGEEL